MPPGAAATMSMRQLFNSCQDQSVAEKKLAKCFWQNAASGEAWDDVEEILAHTLHLEKVLGCAVPPPRTGPEHRRCL
jgi:hypothetical protein